MTVSAISILVIAVREEAVNNIEDDENPETTIGAGENGKNSSFVQVLYIQYFIAFWKKSVSMLFNLGIEINAIYPTFAKELKLLIRPIDIGA